MAEGHRQRLKSRFLKEGIDGFEPHNALELLLFYSLPQIDTNKIAHALIDRFGSFSGVLDADYNDLITVDGVGAHTASLIKLIPELARYYQAEKASGNIKFASLDAIGEYLIAKFLGETVEVVYMLLFDNKMELIDTVRVHEGSVSSASVSIRKMAEIALSRRAATVVVAHNHPKGLPMPSPEDINVTRTLKEALSVLEIELYDHFIVAENKYSTVLHPMQFAWGC